MSHLINGIYFWMRRLHDDTFREIHYIYLANAEISTTYSAVKISMNHELQWCNMVERSNVACKFLVSFQQESWARQYVQVNCKLFQEFICFKKTVEKNQYIPIIQKDFIAHKEVFGGQVFNPNWVTFCAILWGNILHIWTVMVNDNIKLDMFLFIAFLELNSRCALFFFTSWIVMPDFSFLKSVLHDSILKIPIFYAVNCYAFCRDKIKITMTLILSWYGPLVSNGISGSGETDASSSFQ